MNILNMIEVRNESGNNYDMSKYDGEKSNNWQKEISVQTNMYPCDNIMRDSM